MKISHSKLATAVCHGYVHSGKVDRDDGFKHRRASETKRRVCKKTKTKQNRLIDLPAMLNPLF